MRDGKLDFFKCYLILSVVLGHCLNIFCTVENGLHCLLRTFDLPMFMYISGYLLKGSIERYDWKQLILNKITTIIFPAVIWMLVSLLCGDRCFYYFLWAIFASSAIVTITHICFKNKTLELVVLCVTALLFHLIPKNIVNISYLFPFFIFGYFSQNISTISKVKGVVSLLTFIVLFIFVWDSSYNIWNTGGYILSNSIYVAKAVFLRILIGVAGIYTATFILGHIYDCSKNNNIMNLTLRIGKETLSIYLVQHIVVEIGLALLIKYLNINRLISEHFLLFGYVVAPIVALTLLLVMYYIVALIKNYKWTKWMFGFKLSLKNLNCI